MTSSEQYFVDTNAGESFNLVPVAITFTSIEGSRTKNCDTDDHFNLAFSHVSSLFFVGSLLYARTMQVPLNKARARYVRIYDTYQKQA